ncbi:hypothetical protein SAY87_012896 [Trapa incisa]|uniref:Uncharacterized protein n=1 Tax=Trapa incisa TaxID=236973 RepID=A0AAN7QCI5_9MYRT|nr:hypothetical protein SAY87_012896 [Trapa incisa]
MAHQNVPAARGVKRSFYYPLDSGNIDDEIAEVVQPLAALGFPVVSYTSKNILGIPLRPTRCLASVRGLFSGNDPELLMNLMAEGVIRQTWTENRICSPHQLYEFSQWIKTKEGREQYTFIQHRAKLDRMRPPDFTVADYALVKLGTQILADLSDARMKTRAAWDPQIEASQREVNRLWHAQEEDTDYQTQAAQKEVNRLLHSQEEDTDYQIKAAQKEVNRLRQAQEEDVARVEREFGPLANYPTMGEIELNKAVIAAYREETLMKITREVPLDEDLLNALRDGYENVVRKRKLLNFLGPEDRRHFVAEYMRKKILMLEKNYADTCAKRIRRTLSVAFPDVVVDIPTGGDAEAAQPDTGGQDNAEQPDAGGDVAGDKGDRQKGKAPVLPGDETVAEFVALVGTNPLHCLCLCLVIDIRPRAARG